jgi:hypothetical protein
VRAINIPDDSHRLVFYIRYRIHRTDEFVARTLAHTLAPLHPRLFDVTSPEEFRKALATILRDIAKASQTMNANAPKGFE